jgi:hypothetical protein
MLVMLVFDRNDSYVSYKNRYKIYIRISIIIKTVFSSIYILLFKVKMVIH